MIGIGLDIGGTKTLGVLTDADGKVLAQVRRPTSPGPAGVLATAEAVIDELRPAGEELWPIGIGIPGLVDPARGAVKHAVNLELDGDWLHVRHELEGRLGHAVLVENDVNAAALGATTLLPAGAPVDLAYLSIGTGLAAGLVLDGRLRRGVHHAAGEIGHVPVDPAGALCACGQRGCLETMGAGPALQSDGLERFAVAVAAAVRLLCLTVDVEAVVLGGGVAQIGEPLRAAVAAALDAQAASSPFLESLHLSGRLTVVPADYPVAAVGAAFLGEAVMIEVPGLIDLQVNGAHGIDITATPERLWEVAAVLPQYGVTAFLPTVITSSADARAGALKALAAGRPDDVPAGAVPLGLHFEGPMLAASHKGAHPAQWLADPSLDLVDGWSREAGVAMVTLAPELPGALEVIAALVDRGVVVSIGHTAASAEDVEAAVAAGATCVTHLFNGMPSLHHRSPGVVGATLGGSLTAGVLVDGHHLAPDVVRLAWRALGPDRFLSVSDTTAGLGLPPGPHRLGDQDVVVEGGAVRLADGSTLAGSAASLTDCLRELVRVTGCSIEDAVATATTTPARLLGVEPVGRVTLGPSLEVLQTVVG